MRSAPVAGDGRFFDSLISPAGLAEVKTYADGIGPWKPQVMKLSGPTGTFAGVDSAVIDTKRTLGVNKREWHRQPSGIITL